MSAPTTHDPRFVNTRDGVCWERRAVTDSGLGLYAVEGSCTCPEFKMATFVELAAHGIVEWADVLPMPVGPEPQPSERDRLRAAYIEALKNAARTNPCPVLGDQFWSGCVHYDDAGHVSGVGSCHSERRADAVLGVRDAELNRLRAQVAALLEERHTTNEALDDAVQEPRARRVLDPAEYGRVWSLIPDRTDRERVDAVLASIGLLTPPPPSEPGTCVAWFWDGSGWWQCAESTDHDPREGHGNGEGLSWADGVEYAGFPCPCPPADQPGPHQVGCPLAEVPRLSERPVNELTAVYMPVAAYREDPHDSPLYHDYKGPGRDFPELGGAS